MLIHDMTREASIDLLTRTRLGRLAYAHEGQSYIAPMNFEYQDNYLYGFSTLGQKIICMRANPRVCVEAEELASPQNWATIIVLGTYEELPDTPQYEDLRRRAWSLLQRRPLWWEPGYVKTVLHEETRPMDFMYFRIHIDQISGHRGIPNTVSRQESSATHATHEGPVRRLRRIFG